MRSWLVRIAFVGFIICSLNIANSGTAAADALDDDTATESSGRDASLADDLVQRQLDQIETGEIEQFWQDIHQRYDGFLPSNTPPDLLELISGGQDGFSLKGTLTGFLHYFFYEVMQHGKLLGTIVILSVFCLILQQMQTAFEQNTVSKVAYAVAYMVLIILAINSFAVAMETAKTAISSMVNFMMALIPLILTLLATIGNFTSAAVFHPLIVFLIHLIGTMIYTFVFPLLFFSAVLGIVSSFTDKYPLTKLAIFLRNISIGALAVGLTVFLGVISVQGAASAVTDGVTIRTAKYVTGNFVPVIGGLFAEAADTVVGASLLVKNTVGLSGVLILLFICAFPALKILAVAMIYSLTGAVMQPLGDSPIIQCLDTIGKSLIAVFAAMATVGLMFFIALTIMITAGNVSVMMR